MMGDEPHDAFTIGCGQNLPRIGQALGQPVHPDATIGIEHDLDHRRVVQEAGDGGSERGAQHARTARASFRVVM